MKYINPYFKKVKKSLDMKVICGICKSELIFYKKIGKGALLRLWISRIKSSKMDLSNILNELRCPFYKNVLGYRVKLGRDIFYKMSKGFYETKIIY